MKFKPFKAPKKFVAPKAKEGTEDGSSDGAKTSAQKKMEDKEVYEVMYTKHINQKIKSWEEGLFLYDLKNFKA